MSLYLLRFAFFYSAKHLFAAIQIRNSRDKTTKEMNRLTTTLRLHFDMFLLLHLFVQLKREEHLEILLYLFDMTCNLMLIYSSFGLILFHIKLTKIANQESKRSMECKTVENNKNENTRSCRRNQSPPSFV